TKTGTFVTGIILHQYKVLLISGNVIAVNRQCFTWDDIGGNTTLFNTMVSGNSDTVDGRAIYNASTGFFIIDHSSIFGNTALDGGAILNTGTISINNSTISGNLAIYGGSISNFDGTVTIKNSTLSGNKVRGGMSNISAAGGAIYGRGGYIGIVDSIVSVNSATGFKGGTGVGGAIALNGGDAIIRNSTISANKATSGTGASGFGGAIDTFGTSLLVENSTISGNSAIGGSNKNGHGGGFFNGGFTKILNSTISGNQSTLSHDREQHHHRQ